MFLPTWFSAPAVEAAILLPLFLVLVDIVTGIASALKGHTFSPRYVASFMQTQLMPYVATVVPAFATAIVTGQGVTGAALTLHTFLLLFYWKQLHSIASNVLELSGVPDSTVLGGLKVLLKVLFPGASVGNEPTDHPDATPPSAPAAVSTTPTAA